MDAVCDGSVLCGCGGALCLGWGECLRPFIWVVIVVHAVVFDGGCGGHGGAICLFEMVELVVLMSVVVR